MAKTDMQLKEDIEAELSWDPKVNAAAIGVSVDNGVVSLNGAVETYAQRWAAEDAAKRVFGVRIVAQDLTVKILGDHKHTDSEIASAVKDGLKWDTFVPETITATVTEGAVTLNGKATWNFEREAAERAVRNLRGVVAVYNAIALKPNQASSSQVKEKVQAALERQAATDAKSIHVETSGGKVTLTGTASSWQSTRDAANAAWAAPGVTEVVNDMHVATTY